MTKNPYPFLTLPFSVRLKRSATKLRPIRMARMGFELDPSQLLFLRDENPPYKRESPDFSTRRFLLLELLQRESASMHEDRHGDDER